MSQGNERYFTMIKESAESLKQQLGWDSLSQKPKLAVVLGSGLGLFADSLTDKKVVPYHQVKHNPVSKVPGHAGQWVFGKTTTGQPLLVAQGRVHYYEGHSLEMVTLSIRVLKELGIQHVILTNAAGTADPQFKAGSFLLIDDHINMMGHSALYGIADPRLGPQFVDMSQAYEHEINTRLYDLCTQKHPEIILYRGVYCAFFGPQYESPAEVRMAGKMGASAVGMSTVPECVVAKQCGLKVSGVSCMTNLGCGIGKTPLNHQEVADMGKKLAPQFCTLLNELIGIIL